jgi:predicted transcriptional regulator
MTDAVASEVTPVMSKHARERCAEMEISTKVAKRIWRFWSVKRGMHDQAEGKLMVTSAEEPDYAVIVDTRHEVPIIVTVLFNERDVYVREGVGYRLAKAS